MSQPSCTLVIAVLDEEENIPVLYEQILVATGKRPDIDWEFLFVDDGSTDATYPILIGLNRQDPRVKCVRFSRNFGPHDATAAGIHYASGDAVVIMAGDLQDPPEVVVPFVEAWLQGYHIVWGVREKREDAWWYNLLAQSFYAVFNRLSGVKHARKGSGSFLLMSRPVVEAYKLIREHNRATFEMIHWLGFTQTEVPFTRPARLAGTAKFGFGRRLKTAIDSLFSVTQLPVRIITYAGFGAVAASFVYACSILISRLLGHVSSSVGWSSLMVVMLLLNGLSLLSVGILGEYAWRILEEARSRPLYVVMDTLGDVMPPQNAGNTPSLSSNQEQAGPRNG